VPNQRWAVVIQSKNIPFELELSTAICRCLHDLGHSGSIVQDGDPAGIESDVLLLLSNLGNYPAYGRKLRHSGTKRPVTVLWQLDPLPPEDLTPEAEALGLRAARWRDWLGLGLHQSAAGMPRWKKIATLFRFREWAGKQCSASGYRQVSRLIQRGGGETIDWKQIRGVMESWQRILASRQEGWLDYFVVSTHQRLRFLKSRGIPAHFIPVGAYEAMGRDLGRPRDIPVGFLGAVKHGRRAVLLGQLRERLQAKGIALDQMVHGCYGEKRCEWLNRVRILVSLHHYSWNPAWMRFLIAAKCGTLVVSEPMEVEHPMQAGVHYVAATLAEMPEVIGKLLDQPEKISQLTSAAANLCNHELTLSHAVEEISRLINRTDDSPSRNHV
jgi:hypothetical protein